MPRFVASILAAVLNQRERSLKGSMVFLIGASYKRHGNDAQESPAIEIISELWRRGAKADYHDPYVPTLEVEGRLIHSHVMVDETIEAADCVVIVTDHSCIDYPQVVELAAVIVDTRNATRSIV